MIPKILHRMWLDKSLSNNLTAPKQYDKFVSTFNIRNPDFKILFWNMERINNLFDIYPEIQKYKLLWNKLQYHIQKCDVARYIILYLYGGVYVDLDYTCFKNLSPLLNRELLLVYESAEIKPKDIKSISNGFMGSISKHPIWLEWLDFIDLSLHKISNSKNSIFGNVMNTTGPHNFGTFFVNSKYSDIELVDTCDIIPLTYEIPNKIVKECIHRNNNSPIITTDDYYKHFGNYTHTKWLEGSGWMKEHFSDQSDTKQNYSLNNSKIFIVLFIIIIIIIIFIIILKNNKS